MLSLRNVSPSFLFELFLSIFIVGEATRISTYKQKEVTVCGYQSCPLVEANKLNVHLIPHTHDDVGWLKTVDQYYFGSQSTIQKAGVQYILDTVIQELLRHLDRRFIYVETAFLWKWWLRQDQKMKNDVRSLINNGRLEIISGAWSMNDEAITHYHSIIDQFTWGLRRLNDTFGPCARPHIGWQIDPFGHSREQASIFARMGFDGMFLGRLDYQDKNERLAKKTPEFVWKGSESLGNDADLFTSVLFNNYSPPPGFCFDVLCDDDPIIDDPDSPEYNVDTRVKLFLDFVQIQAKSYRTNNVLLTMGEDFNYQNAETWFTNLDKLISYANARNGSSVNVFYSTPSCYLKALNDVKVTWPTKTDDFFPYANDNHSYWTGYYTSRPTLKLFERLGNNLLQVSKQLSVLAGFHSEDDRLNEFREAMGVMQHHDAVTGTEKQKVASDYARILHNSMRLGEDVASEALRKLMSKTDERNSSLALLESYSCLELNISSCKYTEDNQQFVITLYNPQSQLLSTYVRLPVRENSYDVKDSTGTKITTQILPIPKAVLDIPGRSSNATKELVFRAVDIPPLGYQSYYVNENVNVQVNEIDLNLDSGFSIGDELYNITIDWSGDVLVQWQKLEGMQFVQSFHYYEGAEGNNKEARNRSSGAYIFRPKKEQAENITNAASFVIFKGPLVEELHHTVNDWISQVIRVYHGEEHIEFEWLVGPIPVANNVSKEIVTRYSSDLKSNRVFYTDSNGRETIKRKRDYRPTWNLQLSEPVAGNYYPVSTRISLKDEKRALELGVLTDRSQGGTSLLDGEIELMLHRRLLYDDAFGVEEALNEEAFGKGLVVRGQHHVIGGNMAGTQSLASKAKSLALKLALRPWIFIMPVENVSFDAWSKSYKMKNTGLSKKLPPNIRILTLEPWKNNSILLRLEHPFEIGDDPQLSQPVEINIQDLFSSFKIASVRESTLGGNQWLSELKRLEWNYETNDISTRFNKRVRWIAVNDDDAINVHMKPMEIRTFIVEILAQ